MLRISELAVNVYSNIVKIMGYMQHQGIGRLSQVMNIVLFAGELQLCRVRVPGQGAVHRARTHGPPALDVLAPGGEAVLGASGHQHPRRGDRTRHFRRLFFISKSNYFVSTAPLRWMFSPLEAKLYSVQVAINIHGGETALVTFEGCSSFQNQITL